MNVDTTVQEKAIAFPTDARLYHKARCVLVGEAQRAGLELRQSYKRVGKRALQKQGRYAHAQQLKRARKETRKLRTYLGRVIRDIQRKAAASGTELSGRLPVYLERAARIHRQQRADKQKLYRMQAPEVECISKGKEHKKYEFGCKVSVVTTSKRGWVVGMAALHGNPYDGHTLKAAHAQVATLTGVTPEEVFVDKGYRGSQHHPAGVAVYISGRRLKGTLKRLLRRRSAIEPVIGHLKQDHRMKRNYLQGKDGDCINALLVGCGFNLRKLLRVFFWLIFGWPEQALEIDLANAAAASTPVLVLDPARANANSHTVARGETLTSIAKMHKVGVEELQKFNHIENDRKLQIGQIIQIPVSGAAAPATSPTPSPDG